MQARSYPASEHPRLHVYPSEAADTLKQALLARACPEHAGVHLEGIGRLLVESVARAFHAQGVFDGVAPILVLRGGLTMYVAARHCFPGAPLGVVLPVRVAPSGLVHVACGDVPSLQPGGTYLVMDQLLASGAAMAAVVVSLWERLGSESRHRIALAVPFASHRGLDRILSEFPAVTMHTIWHQEELLADGRMDGPGFDIGDCACGTEGLPRIQWGAVSP